MRVCYNEDTERIWRSVLTRWHVIFEEPKQVRALAWLFWGLSNHERRTVYELY